MAEDRRADRSGREPDELSTERQQNARRRILPREEQLRKISAAAVPYRKKSYHSIVVPTVLAMIARIRCVRRTCGDGAVVAISNPRSPCLPAA
jgi:hypothetical protein